MSIVKLKDKRSGTVYVYESESYWDKEKGQPRNKRKLIGKLDEAGNIVPTGKSRRQKPTSDAESQKPVQEEIRGLEEKLQKAERDIRERDLKISLLEKQKKETEAILKKLLEKLTQEKLT